MLMASQFVAILVCTSNDKIKIIKYNYYILVWYKFGQNIHHIDAVFYIMVKDFNTTINQGNSTISSSNNVSSNQQHHLILILFHF